MSWLLTLEHVLYMLTVSISILHLSETKGDANDRL